MTIRIQNKKRVGFVKYSNIHKYPLRSMEKGDFFFIAKDDEEFTEKTAHNVRCAASRVKTLYGIGFTVKDTDDGVMCIRVS